MTQFGLRLLSFFSFSLVSKRLHILLGKDFAQESSLYNSHLCALGTGTRSTLACEHSEADFVSHPHLKLGSVTCKLNVLTTTWWLTKRPSDSPLTA